MGWGPELSNNFSKSKKMHVNFENAKFTDRSLSEVAKDAITKITKEYPAPYTIMLSGGIDSQAMLWCWKQSGVPFRSVCIRYVDNDGNILNNHDISNLKKVSEYHNISVDYIDFNVINFLENYLNEYATKYQCTSPQITTYMCMSEIIYMGTVLFSGDFLATAFYDYTIYGLKRYSDITKRNVIPFFLLHDAELTTALTKEYKLLRNHSLLSYSYNNDWRKNSYLDKVNSMKKIGIPVFQQETKYSGFEKIKEIYDTRNDLVSTYDRIRFSNKPSKRNFDILFRYKLTDIIKYDDEIIYENAIDNHIIR